MIFVFDTSVFIVLKNFYTATFPSLWAQLGDLVGKGGIISVREVLQELENYNDTDFIQEWAKRNKAIFAKPSNEETVFVARILSIPHFQPLIGQKALLKGTAVADPFVIAAAKIRNGTVVTEEREKPNAAKIPNVCAHFHIPCLNLETFMKQQGWTF
jgi:hypothetical protein